MTEALLVIDLQRSFCAADGSMAAQGADTSALIATLVPCKALVDAARAARIPVIWTRIGWAADYADGGLLVHALRPNLARIGALRRGSPDHEIVPAMGYRDGEWRLDKTRFSALVGTTLEAGLRQRGIDAITVCGVTTSMCVESTVRDLGQRDFAVTLAADACADFTPARHQAALETMAFGFAQIRPSCEIVERWARRAPAGAASAAE